MTARPPKGPPARPLAALHNLGPTSAEMLAEVGIETPEDLRRVGVPMAYAILRHRFASRVNRLFLWALAGALDGRHWNSYSAEEKADLEAAASGPLAVGPR